MKLSTTIHYGLYDTGHELRYIFYCKDKREIFVLESTKNVAFKFKLGTTRTFIPIVDNRINILSAIVDSEPEEFSWSFIDGKIFPSDFTDEALAEMYVRIDNLNRMKNLDIILQ